MSSLPETDVLEEQRSPVERGTYHDSGTAVLVCLPSVSHEGLHAIVQELSQGFTGDKLLVASCNAPADEASESYGPVKIIHYPPQPAHSGWILSASDYQTAAGLTLAHNAQTTLLLGADAASISGDSLRAMCSVISSGGADLALPRYKVGPHEALISAALLHPLSRSLFGVEARMPLPYDVAFSTRMASRFQTAARRSAGVPGTDPLLWPGAEAATSSYVIHEVPVGPRTIPQPNGDLNSLLAQIAGSLFGDIETKAAFWQRARSSAPRTGISSSAASTASVEPGDLSEIQHLVDDFRNAYLNLQDLWSLVLSPQTLLALKKLSLSRAESFAMPTSLWARTVYDFVLAYRLRTINRGHLLGALTPLYLAWVASHLRYAGDDPARVEEHIEQTATAFIIEKPYMVARWRWPDRFNP